MCIEVISALERDTIKISSLLFKLVNQTSRYPLTPGFFGYTKVRNRCLPPDNSIEEIAKKASRITFCDE